MAQPVRGSSPSNPRKPQRLGDVTAMLPLHGSGRSFTIQIPSPTRSRGGQGEPGGTRAMVACEPGQDGNGAAISIAFMCPGAPPRLSPTPASSDGSVAIPRMDPSPFQGPTERASCPDPGGLSRLRPTRIRSAIPWSPGVTDPSGSRTWSARTTSSRPSGTRSASIGSPTPTSSAEPGESVRPRSPGFSPNV